jgi:hypothetical protein
MSGIALLPHSFHGEWNYTIMPNESPPGARDV